LDLIKQFGEDEDCAIITYTNQTVLSLYAELKKIGKQAHIKTKLLDEILADIKRKGNTYIKDKRVHWSEMTNCKLDDIFYHKRGDDDSVYENLQRELKNIGITTY
jgi:hypothetical protein